MFWFRTSWQVVDGILCLLMLQFGASAVIPPYISMFNPRAAVSLPDYGKCNSAPPPRDGVRGVTVTKTGSGAIVVSAKTERKNGISVQNTNQLAGNRTFIILLTLISFRGKCPHSPFSWLAVSQLSCPSEAFEPYLLCVWCGQTQPFSMPRRWHIQTACLPQRIAAAMSELAPGYRDHGGKMWSILSWQMLKCDGGVERLFIDRVNKLQDA